MSTRILRRLRGVAGTAALWGAAGTFVGLALAAVIELTLVIPRDLDVQAGELLFGLGLACGIAGALGGLAFALLLTATSRGRTLERLRADRVGLLGAAASGGVLLLAAQSIPVAAGAALLGWAAAAGSVRVARRALAGPTP